jgi:hypothetical protein
LSLPLIVMKVDGAGIGMKTSRSGGFASEIV